ncbi:WD repeat and FYVE domain-containing protein 2-like isoform X1 [Biomphalaria glabrata]|uniref:WD repeat and FYVE domain-containing protein 2-like isoform X1 n=1 Tax=Biomphalaria glabrata TaxID=6526 RepID=A0A9U8E295_BIOGL|nr:WD repeat and FYVE domain-containing protein 2-like isoform X1 [Biomphalaria glabrata]
MAAEINPEERRQGNVRKPILLNKIEGCPDTINEAIIIPREDGVISVSDDKTLRVWLKRDSGQYWPSICHSMSSEASCVNYNPETRRLFVGQDNGTISEFEITEDYNRLIHRRDYIAHQSRVTSVKFCLSWESVLSCGKDKYFMWHCSETGRRFCGYQANAMCLCLEYDEQSKYVFIGDYSGQVAVLKLKDSSFDFIVTLKGHAVSFLNFRRDLSKTPAPGLSALRLLIGLGSIRCLSWDPDKQLLFSGSFDQSVIVWDIGGRKGTAFELQGHKDKVQGLAHSKSTRQLLSGSDDCVLGIWDMDIQRLETPDWIESDVCQKCDSPFFWNFRKMWSDRKVGIRQHHCRNCGKALCNNCCSKLSTIPNMGYEYEVRVCDSCFEAITPEEKAPHATFHDMKHSIVHMHLDETRKILLTTGKDRVMKLWDMSLVLH